VKNTQRYRIRSVERALSILDVFVETGPELTLAQICSQTRLTPSTAYRLVSNLVRLGYLSANGGADYRLGSSVLRLAGVAISQLDLRQKAAPAMERLRDETKETVHLATLDGQRIIYLEKLEGLYAIGMTGSRVGKTAPAHCTALGKVMIATGDEAQRDRILRGKLQPATPQSITDPAILRANLDEIRQQGYALDWGEFESEVRCVAAPVRDHTDRVVAAISVSGPAQRMEPEIKNGRLPARLVAAADEVSQTLGAIGARTAPANPPAAGRRARR
jgi:DNA-binding IclR family transcriptional regulator